jgi:drug/metabolite transporter (DMT)-like permease
VFNATAHLLRYIALAHSPVSLVAPLINSINGLLVFPLSFLINRKIETFNLRIILGAIAVIGGVLFIFLAA